MLADPLRERPPSGSIFAVQERPGQGKSVRRSPAMSGRSDNSRSALEQDLSDLGPPNPAPAWFQ